MGGKQREASRQGVVHTGLFVLASGAGPGRDQQGGHPRLHWKVQISSMATANTQLSGDCHMLWRMPCDSLGMGAEAAAPPSEGCRAHRAPQMQSGCREQGGPLGTATDTSDSKGFPDTLFLKQATLSSRPRC